MSAIALGLDRTVLELKMYSREKEAVFFSFLFPILLLALFSVIFGSQFDGADAQRHDGRRLLPARHALGRGAAHQLPDDGDVGHRRARRRHPQAAAGHADAAGRLLPRQGRPGRGLLDGAGRAAPARRPGRSSASQLPTTADRWAVFALVFALGVFGGTVLGIAYSSMATARTVGAVVIGPMLVLQFISGVYIAFDDVPQWLQQVASVFPLKWIAQGMRSVFFPDRARLGRDGRVPGRPAAPRWCSAPGPWAGSCCAC